MASPRKFSEKIALLNQREAEESARFEQIMKEVSDVTNRKAASTSASPTARGSAGEVVVGCAAAAATTTSSGRPLSVKSAGASPPQSGGKHLHISLGNQYGGSLPNVNQQSQQQQQQQQQDAAQQALAVHSYELKNALSNLEEYNQQQGGYQAPQQQQQQPQQQQQQQHQPRERQASSQERRSTGSVGPMRSRPIEKRHDTSPYSGVPYLSPPNPETWRRTNSDSALHQSANEACQAAQAMASHRRDHQRSHGGSSSDNRDGHRHLHHHGFIERPRSSCDMPRVPGINVHLSGTQPGAQIPIGNNTGSLPDLSNVHFPAPLHTPLDQEDHSSGGSPYSNSPQTSSPTTLSPTSLAQAGRLSLTQDHSPPSAQQGITLENNASSSQQDLRVGYSPQQQQQQPQQVPQQQQQQPPQSQPQNIPGSTSPSLQQTHPVAHSPGHYVYQQQHSPVGPASPNASQAQVHQQSSPSQYNYQSSPQSSLTMYRNSQMVNRPSPQSSPSLTFQGSPLSYSNNISAPSSPTSHHGPPTLSLDPQDQNVYASINQVHADFEQFSMDWAQMMQQLEDTSYNLSTSLDEMDSPAAPQTMGPYINSPSHTGTYTQSDILNVASELGTADSDYFSSSTLQQLSYPTRTPTTTQQLTPQTPNTPTITLTDCSLGPDDLVSSDFAKDFGTSITASFSQDLFPTDDPLGQDLNSLRQEDINALRQDLDPLDLDELQRLANADMVISDPTTEADFRLEQR